MYTGDEVSTYIGFLIGLGGPGSPGSPVPAEFFSVRTRARDGQVPVYQYIRAIGPGIIQYITGMLHNLYPCIYMIVKQLRDRGPIPPNGGYAAGRGRAYPFNYVPIFSSNFFTVSNPGNFTQKILHC